MSHEPVKEISKEAQKKEADEKAKLIAENKRLKEENTKLINELKKKK